MGIREGIESHRIAVVLGAVAVLAVSVGLIVYFNLPARPEKPRPHLAYFYDQNTKTLFAAPAQPGPIETESGKYQGEPAGVRAHVFACGRCADAANRFTGWLSKPAPSTEKAEEMIRRPQDSKWVPSNSPEADKIVQEVQKRCKGGVGVQYCSPEQSVD